MSGVIVIAAPVIAAAVWPSVVTAASVVMVAMGYAAVQTSQDSIVEGRNKTETQTEVEIELNHAEEVGNSVGREETLTFTKEDIEVRFSRSIRGRLKVCVTGVKRTNPELRQIGEELAGRVIQQYTYNRLIQEMQKRDGLSLVEESVDEDNTIHIKLRSWED